MKLIFADKADKHESFLQIDTTIFDGDGQAFPPKFPKVASLQCLYNISKKKLKMKHAYNHQSFLQVNFNTSGIKVFYKMMLSLLMGMIKHSQSTQSNKFAISLQYLTKEVRD